MPTNSLTGKNCRKAKKYEIMINGSKQNIGIGGELKYRRKWVHQLRVEFKQICSWYRISLAAPAFRISDSAATLGSWNPETRTICISSTLINEYSWDAVINVLKHEMAHQYIHEFLGRGMEQPHGLTFSETCEKLGVLYPFNTAAGDTPKVFTAHRQHGSDSEYDKKVNKGLSKKLHRWILIRINRKFQNTNTKFQINHNDQNSKSKMRMCIGFCIKCKGISIKTLMASHPPGLQNQTHVLSCDSYSPPLFDTRSNSNSFL